MAETLMCLVAQLGRKRLTLSSLAVQLTSEAAWLNEAVRRC